MGSRSSTGRGGRPDRYGRLRGLPGAACQFLVPIIASSNRQTRVSRSEHFSRVPIAVSVALALLIASVVTLIIQASPVLASHYRANQITWMETATNTAEFELTGSWRMSFFFGSTPAVGDTFQPDCIAYGDGFSDCPTYSVTSTDALNDIVSGEAMTTHTYTGTGPFVASILNCCRLSGPQHVNNPDGSVQFATTVDFEDTVASPVSSISPIVDCPINSLCQFTVPALDPDGQGLRWRLATSDEAGGDFAQPGPPHATNAALIDSATGLYSWDTTGATLNEAGGDTYYSTQVIIENFVGTSVVSSIAVDFFIRLSTSTNQAPVFVDPTPADSTVINTTVGSVVSFSTAASDPDSGDVVTLGMLGKPAAATYSTVSANPATGSFSWTPTASGSVILTLIAQDQNGLGATQRSIVINVSSGTPTSGTLTITKTTVGGTGTFDFTVDCAGDAFDTTRQISDSGSATVAGILTGTQCAVLETAHEDFDSVSEPANGTITMDSDGETVSFTNTLKPTTADVAISKSCTPAEVAPGATVTCTLTVTNNGPAAANNVVVTDTLPAGLSLVAEGSPAGDGFSCDEQEAGTSFTCTRATQGPGGLQVTYSAQLADTVGPNQSFTNLATVTNSVPDPNPGNNTSVAEILSRVCTITASGSRSGITIRGTSGPDVICGTAGSDKIYGLEGNDIIFGFGGHDSIQGGGGRDWILGGAGDDKLLGGADNDTINGSRGDDSISGGTGNDDMFGGAGKDKLVGNAGNDHAAGGAGQFDTCNAEGETTCED
jgi:uncharacterized repeat protein (TIGR01451 family)